MYLIYKDFNNCASLEVFSYESICYRGAAGVVYNADFRFFKRTKAVADVGGRKVQKSNLM
jgi:hypothetical protein